MLYFLVTYAGTIAAIATAVGAAMWRFTMWGGKTALEEWLKRNYKAWELNEEKPYKEDFKRFEDKLNKLSAEAKTRFDHSFTQSALTIDKLYALCREAMRTFNIYVTVATMYQSNATGLLLSRRVEFSDELMKLIAEVSKLSSDKSIYLTQNMELAIRNFISYLLQKAVLENYSETVTDEINEELTKRLSLIHYIAQGFLGVIEIPKVKEPTAD